MKPGEIQYQEMTDVELVTAAQEGNEQAFSELFTRHRLNCVKVATSILKNPDDAEEEVQNSFWKAYLNIGRFNGDSQFATWVNRIVINQCLMRLRSSRRRRMVSIDEMAPGEQRPAFELSEYATPESELGREELVRLMHSEILRIPPILRDTLVLKDIEERPTAEVAEHLSLTVAAVKSRLLRARRLLRDRIERHAGVRGTATLLTQPQ